SEGVGLIRDRRATRIAGCRATLEESVMADLLLHVIDAASRLRDEHIVEVNKVLEDSGAQDIPRVLVYNKIDQTGHQPRIDRDDHGTIARVLLSAQTREGLEGVRQAIVEYSEIAGNNSFNV